MSTPLLLPKRQVLLLLLLCLHLRPLRRWQRRPLCLRQRRPLPLLLSLLLSLQQRLAAVRSGAANVRGHQQSSLHRQRPRQLLRQQRLQLRRQEGRPSGGACSKLALAAGAAAWTVQQRQPRSGGAPRLKRQPRGLSRHHRTLTLQ